MPLAKGETVAKKGTRVRDKGKNVRRRERRDVRIKGSTQCSRRIQRRR